MTIRPLRRVVTGFNEANQAIITEDGAPTRVFDNLGQPGLVFHEVWNTQSSPAPIGRSSAEPGEDKLALAPPKGGTRIRVLDVPPDRPDDVLETVFDNIAASDNFKGAASQRHASFHRTETVDYGIMLEGELVLIMDEGETTVRPGDIVVQRGTNHGWANRSNANARIAFVLIDGKYDADIA